MIKNKKLKLFIISSIFLFSFFSFFFFSDLKVNAQPNNDINVETMGYSSVGPTYFVLGGYYSGNFNREGFTTYFEFKKNYSDLDNEEGREETIKIVRKTKIDEANDFYIGPELNIASTYYFRAVGFFNNSPDQKYYGNTLSLNTGYIPVGFSIPFTIDENNQPIEYVPPVCDQNQILVNGVCVTPGTTIIKSSKKNILSFDFRNVAENVRIFNYKVIVKVPNDTDITSLTPFVLLSPKATISPGVGVPTDFSGGFVYKTTAEDGSSKNYNIIVTKSVDPSIPDTCELDEDGNKINPNCTEQPGGSSGGDIGNSDGNYNGGTGGAGNIGDTNFGDIGNGLYVKSEFEEGDPSVLIPCGTYRYKDGTYQNPSTKDLSSIKKEGYVDVSRSVSNPCSFGDLLNMVNRVIKFILLRLVIPVAALMFVYAGFMMITSGGNTEQRSKALKIFKNVGIGLVFIAASWLIISMILSLVGYDGSWIGF